MRAWFTNGEAKVLESCLSYTHKKFMNKYTEQIRLTDINSYLCWKFIEMMKLYIRLLPLWSTLISYCPFDHWIKLLRIQEALTQCNFDRRVPHNRSKIS